MSKFVLQGKFENLFQIVNNPDAFIALKQISIVHKTV